MLGMLRFNSHTIEELCALKINYRRETSTAKSSKGHARINVNFPSALTK